MARTRCGRRVVSRRSSLALLPCAPVREHCVSTVEAQCVRRHVRGAKQPRLLCSTVFETALVPPVRHARGANKHVGAQPTPTPNPNRWNTFSVTVVQLLEHLLSSIVRFETALVPPVGHVRGANEHVGAQPTRPRTPTRGSRSRSPCGPPRPVVPAKNYLIIILPKI